MMSSKATGPGLDLDPDNNTMWRYNMRRLSAEEIRDSILNITGELDLNYGGPSVYPEISKEVLQGQSKVTWKTNMPKSHQNRRTVYTFVKRSVILPMVESFDGATTDSSCPERFATTQPTQALSMINSEFMNRKAEALAKRLNKEGGKTLKEKVDYAWKLATGRKATDKEHLIITDFFHKFKTETNADEAKSMQQFCLIVLNLNEFIYLD